VLTPDDIAAIFQSIRKEEFASSDVAADSKDDGTTLENRTMSSELTYPEFLEALIAIAHHRNPDPYIPLAHRMESFLRRDLFPNVLRIIKNVG